MIKAPIPNSYWVIEGRLLAGEYPHAHAPGAAVEGERDNLAPLLAAGIDVFVDLTDPRECAPYDGLLPESVEYLRRPISDQGLPRLPQQMRQIQQELGSMLGEGRRVYVHCRAGIGRTGTVIGCFLAERQSSGADALDQLNLLWQQSARSRSWLTVPQTPEQQQYILDWPKHAAVESIARAAATPAAPVPQAIRTLRDRVHGALLGLAVGDALAAATQYKHPGSFAPIGDMLGGGPFDLPRGAWSDDTATALCVAESLAQQQRFDAHDVVTRLVQWQRSGAGSATGQCVGITASMARALTDAQWRGRPLAGSHDPRQLDPDVLARIAPVVVAAYGDAALAADWAAECARISCQAPRALQAARQLAQMLHAALRGEPKSRLIAAPPVRSAAAAAGAEIVLARVVEALAGTDNFRSGALAVVNAGHDSDVAGAVFGQLAGAHYGVAAIPAAWLGALQQRERIVALADRLLAIALVKVAAQGG